MSNLFSSYRRKPFPIEAVQVRLENMEQIAEACSGTIKDLGEDKGPLSRFCIQIKTLYPIRERQTLARVGDWVTRHNKSYKIYTDKSFRKAFEARSD